MKQCGAVILAAGSGSRMGSAIPKQFLDLCGIPLFLHSVHQFAAVADEIVLVTSEEEIGFCRKVIEKEHLQQKTTVVAGGKERYHSSMAGLACAAEWEYVMIHDAARACVDRKVITASLAAAMRFGSGVAAVPAKDTVKEIDGEGFVSRTLERSRLRIIQTPQTFRTAWIREAYRQMEESGRTEGITDDAMVLETFSGHPVFLSEGDYKNIKVTTPEDMIFAEAIMREKEKGSCR